MFFYEYFKLKSAECLAWLDRGEGFKQSAYVLCLWLLGTTDIQ